MHSTLASLIERAFTGNQRPLEFYLRDQSRLPGPRANLELVYDVSLQLAVLSKDRPAEVQTLLYYLLNDHEGTVQSNTGAEFVLLCGLVGFGACAAVRPDWRTEGYALLHRYASHSSWRLREGVAMAFQQMLAVAPQETIDYLMFLAEKGNYYQQRAAMASIAEPPLLHGAEIVAAALHMQRTILERLHSTPLTDRRREDFRALRQALGYTLSVVTAADPEGGFALMYDCATWGDADIRWILRENLKKKRLSKYVEHTQELAKLLA